MTEGTPRVIALEDNDEDFSVLQMACKRYGRPIELQRFRRGEDLADAITEGTIGKASLFLLDLRMPGGGGMLALRVIRSGKKYAGVPVVMFSTSNNPKEVEKCYDNEATAFHIKLIETPKTLELLARIFGYWLEDCVPVISRREPDAE